MIDEIAFREMCMKKRIVIIGGGPGGYTAAIRAAQLGADVTLCEEGALGGTCLNIGCIPTKSLLHTSEFYHKLKTKSVAGIIAPTVSVDWREAQSHKAQVVAQLTGGVDLLLRRNGVRVLRERGLPLLGCRVETVSGILEADAVILSSGSISASLNFPGSDLSEVLDSAAALSLTDIPKSVVIVGGGVIGVEFATLWGQLGVKVTILEMLPQILPSIDSDVAAFLRETLETANVRIHTSSELREVSKTSSGLAVSFSENGAFSSVPADFVLMAVGRKPNTSGLGLEELGVSMNKGAVETDAFFRTSVPGLYAVGDCNGQNMLAHAAAAQGIAAAEYIMCGSAHYDPKVIPSCVYSFPEIATVGMTEKQAQDLNIDYSSGVFPLSSNGKSLIDGVGGFIKIITDRLLGEVLGVHIIGSRATEVIAEAVLCMKVEGTVEDLVNTIHAHPTVSEAIGEAAMSVFGKSIHGL